MESNREGEGPQTFSLRFFLVFLMSPRQCPGDTRAV